MQPHSLAQLYSSKTDDKLLALAADTNSLVEEARPILASEIRRRNLVLRSAELERQTPTLQSTPVGKFLRIVGELLLNSVVAVIGTAMMESSIWSVIGHAHSTFGVVAREWLLGLTLAALLGFYVGRRWRSKSAMWVWILPAAFFAFGILLYGTHKNSSVF